MHIWLRNGFPIFLVLGWALQPPCRLSIVVLNELAFAAAYLAVSIALVGMYANIRRRCENQVSDRRVSRLMSPNGGVSLRILCGLNIAIHWGTGRGHP